MLAGRQCRSKKAARMIPLDCHELPFHRLFSTDAKPSTVTLGRTAFDSKAIHQRPTLQRKTDINVHSDSKHSSTGIARLGISKDMHSVLPESIYVQRQLAQLTRHHLCHRRPTRNSFSTNSDEHLAISCQSGRGLIFPFW